MEITYVTMRSIHYHYYSCVFLRVLQTPEIEKQPEPVCCHEVQPIAEKTLGPRQNNNPSAEHLQEAKQAMVSR